MSIFPIFKDFSSPYIDDDDNAAYTILKNNSIVFTLNYGVWMTIISIH